jgi:malate synthase
VRAEQLLDLRVPGGEVTEDGLRANVSVGLRYLASWLAGTGAAAIDNLMEDVATAEISRSQVWQWVHAGRFTREHVREVVDAEAAGQGFETARDVFEQVALSEEFVEFLTLPAYEHLE